MLFVWGGMGVGALFGGEPVVHFQEWATGCLGKGRNPVKTPKSREPVVHFLEWATGCLEKGRNQAKVPKSREPVVHF